jgi:probable F420-dependent oxidoreductase
MPASPAPLGYGLTVPLRGVPLALHRDLYAQMSDLGYTDVWTGEAAGYDGFTPLAVAAAWAPRLRLGTAVLPVHTRGPALLAMTAASLAEAAPGRFVLGLGSSGPPFVEHINGIPFTEPYRRVRDTLRFVRAALAGEYVSGHFDSFDIRGFALPNPPRQPVPIILGALRPGMIRLAAREADGLAANFLTPGDLGTVVRILGREAAAGPRPGPKEVVVRLFVCPTRDAAYARRIGRGMLAGILNARTYSAFHDWLGRSEELAACHRYWAAGDVAAAAAAIPEELVDTLLVHGDPDRCREQVQRYVDQGARTVALALLPAPEYGAGPAGMAAMVKALAP